MSVSELKQACETVVNASPSDYVAAKFKERLDTLAAEAAGLRAALEEVMECPDMAYSIAKRALAVPPSPAVAEVQRLRAVEAAT